MSSCESMHSAGGPDSLSAGRRDIVCVDLKSGEAGQSSSTQIV